MRSVNSISRRVTSDEYLLGTAILAVLLIPGGLPVEPDIRIMIAAAPLLVMAWRSKCAGIQPGPTSIPAFVALRTMVLTVLAITLVVVIARIRFPAPLVVDHNHTWVHHILSGYLFLLCFLIWLAAFFMVALLSEVVRFPGFWMSIALTLILIACNRPHPYSLW